MISQRRMGQNQTKAATTNLEVALNTMKIFERDVLFYNMQRYSPSDFFDAYENAHKVVDYGVNGTGVRGTVTSPNGMKIHNAIVELVEDNRIKTTNSRGTYSFKRLDMTSCTIRVRSPKYDTMEMVVNLVAGKLTEVDFKMSLSVVTPVIA